MYILNIQDLQDEKKRKSFADERKKGEEGAKNGKDGKWKVFLIKIIKKDEKCMHEKRNIAVVHVNSIHSYILMLSSSGIYKKSMSGFIDEKFLL